MEYIIYLLIVIAICVGCKWSWKFRVRLKYRPRNRAKELGRMFEESDFSKIHKGKDD